MPSCDTVSTSWLLAVVRVAAGLGLVEVLVEVRLPPARLPVAVNHIRSTGVFGTPAQLW